MILIVTSKNDLTTDFLIQRAYQRAFSVFRLNTEDIFQQFEFSINKSSGSFSAVIYDEVRCKSLNLSEDVEGAYFRKPKPPVIDEMKWPQYAPYLQKETQEAIRSLWKFVCNEKWLNKPDALLRAGNKMLQLKIANDLGFLVPETLVTTISSRVSEFKERYLGEIVAKPILTGHIKETNEILYTQHPHLSQSDSINEIPVIVQRRISKICDLRVTIIGDSVFSAAIYPLDPQAGSLDWREDYHAADGKLRHEVFDLPEDIVFKCKKMLELLDLRFGCIDMVLTPDLEIFFLEINPNGNWAWLEKELGFPMSDKILDLLGGCSNGSIR